MNANKSKRKPAMMTKYGSKDVKIRVEVRIQRGDIKTIKVEERAEVEGGKAKISPNYPLIVHTKRVVRERKEP